MERSIVDASQASTLASLLDPRHHLEGLTVQEHPDVAAIHRENVAWTARWGLVRGELEARKHANIRCASFAAHTYAAADREVVRLGADLITWLYLFDDAFGEGLNGETTDAMRERFDGFVSLLRTGGVPSDAGPFHRALLDLRERCLGRASAGWLERFTASMDDYFKGCLLEVPHRRAGRAPGLSDYRDLRSSSIGAYPVFTLAELSAGDLSSDDAQHPIVREVNYRGALLCAWVNDVYSFRKERLDEEPLNLVPVLAAEYDLNENEAYRAAIEVFNTERAVFIARCQNADTTLSPGARAYIAAVWGWVEGNTAWTSTCGRYSY